jgi:two-component system response regulator FixJ
LNAIRADLPIIVLTAQGDVQTAVRAMKAGASDFLEKPYSDEALLGAIEAALDGTINSSGRDEIAEAVKRVGTLSARERDVLEQLIAGRPNKLIAYYLGITVRTVEVHRARMMERLVVRQSADVIRLGVLARLGRSVSGRRPKG